MLAVLTVQPRPALAGWLKKGPDLLNGGHIGCGHRADLLGLLQGMLLVEGLLFFLLILE